MKKQLLLFVMLAFGAFCIISACKKKEKDTPPLSDEIKIISFTSSKTTMDAFDTCTLTMVATGENLSYLWFSDKGTILSTNDPYIKKFSVCSTCAGNRVVTCKVSNSTGEVSDTVHVKVNH